MMIESNCRKRKCKFYKGVIQLGDEESSQVHYCKAFKKGIPTDISYEDNKHLVPLDNQDNDIVYEKE